MCSTRLAHLVAHGMPLQGAHQQPEGVNRLPQIVARSGEKTRFCHVGLFGGLLLTAQLPRQILVLEAQAQYFNKTCVDLQRQDRKSDNV